MMLRYGLSGTNWTRKSTTIKRLVETLSPAFIEVVSLSSFVAKSPHPMIQRQTVAGSEWMIEQMRPIMTGPRQHEHQVFDRTPLDIMAFTHYALDTNGGDASVCDRVAELSSGFDVIFFCRPAKEWPAPIEPPPETKQFALLIDSLMESARSLMRTPVVEVPWDADARKGAILRWIEERDGTR